jgi:hypothetical protein
MSFMGLASPLNVIIHEGKQYFLSPLSFKEMAEFVLWYQYSELEKQEIVTKILPEEVRNQVLKETHESCRTKVWKYVDEHGANREAPLSWETPEVQASCNTLEGIQQQIYLSLRIKHPELTKAQVNKIVTFESYNAMLNKLLSAMGMIPELNDETTELRKKSKPNLLRRIINFVKSRLIGSYSLNIL